MSLLATASVADPPAISDDIPTVDVALFEVSTHSHTIRGAYRFIQPMHKVLPPDWWTPHEQVAYWFDLPGDVGSVTVRSLLTGRDVLEADIDFQGYVGLEAWDLVADTELVASVGRDHPIDVVIVNASTKHTSNWFVLVLSHPEAPRDVRVVETLWPRTHITRNVPVRPEVRVHNSSDVPEDVAVVVSARLDGVEIAHGVRTIEGLPADSSVVVTFDELVATAIGEVELDVWLENVDGTPWPDTFPTNDVDTRILTVDRWPVYRVVSSYYRPGDVRLRCVPLDVDLDGDMDLIDHYSIPTALLRNDHGVFVDATHLIDGGLGRRVEVVRVADLTFDGHPDLVLGGETAIGLQVNEGGRFVDRTDHLVEQDRHRRSEDWWRHEITATFVDLEGDGDLDIYADVLVFENQGMDPATLEGVAGVDDGADAAGPLGLTVHGVASGSVAIDVSLDGDGEATLTVFDVRGRVVRRLVEARLEAGDRVVHWDGRDDAGRRVAPGQYFIRLAMGDHAIATAVTVLR